MILHEREMDMPLWTQLYAVCIALFFVRDLYLFSLCYVVDSCLVKRVWLKKKKSGVVWCVYVYIYLYIYLQVLQKKKKKNCLCTLL